MINWRVPATAPVGNDEGLSGKSPIALNPVSTHALAESINSTPSVTFMKAYRFFAGPALGVLLAAAVAHADVVTDWNSAALYAIRAERTPPPRASRYLAILHASIYDAVNGISRRHEVYFVPSAVPASASQIAAASSAAHKVLMTFYAGHAATFDALHATTLAA